MVGGCRCPRDGICLYSLQFRGNTVQNEVFKASIDIRCQKSKRKKSRLEIQSGSKDVVEGYIRFVKE